MIIHNPILTGSFTVNGTDVSSITSSAASLTSLNSYTASQNNRNGTYATTGSNTFAGIQTVNSNLVVTGSITAQTLVVQTVTSSVVYSSGSNVFGNNIANTQVFTGSVLVTGSVGIGISNPNSPLEVYAGSGSVFRAVYNGANAVEIGNYKPTGTGGGGYQQLDIASSTITLQTGTAGGGSATERMRIRNDGFIFIKATGTTNYSDGLGLDSDNTSSYILAAGGANSKNLLFYRNGTGTGEAMRITSTGLVGIGTTSPNYALSIKSTTGGANRVQLLPTTDYAFYQIDHSGGTTYIGTDNSTGAVFGNGNYAMSIYNSYAGAINMYTNAALRMTITSNGDIEFKGGAVRANGGYFRLSNSAGTSAYGYFIPKALWLGSGTEQNPSMAAEGGYGLSFFTNGTTAERMTITSGGSVGIGETSPWHKLIVKTATNNNFDLYDNSTGIGIQSVSDNNVGYRTMTIGASILTYQNATGTILTIASNGAITWTNSTYMISGTAGFRFNNSTDAYNNFVALDNGNATLRGTLTQNSSDERLKNNIQIIPNAIDKINQLKGVTFEWNQELYETSRTTDIGVIAQDVQSVLPDAVTLAPFDTNFETNTSKSGENYLTVYYEKLIPLLIEGIKELKAEIEILKTK